jgi:hypothetical protein
VVVSNPGGIATNSSVLLRVNRAPVADASATESLVISLNGTNAEVVLNGSRSSDPDGDALLFTWFLADDPNALATTAVAIRTLPVGTNQLVLNVWDGMAQGSQTMTVEVITTLQALDRLVALLQSGSPKAQPLLAALRAALAAIDSATMEITSITRAQNGKAHLKIRGAAGHTHVVETSTNMIDWTPVGVASLASDGSFEFEDANSADAARFYRVASPK